MRLRARRVEAYVDFPVLLSLVSTTAIVCSVVFAGLQIRNAQNQRSREAQLLLVRSFQTPEFINAMQVLLSLPEGLSKKEIEERVGDKAGLLLFWSRYYGKSRYSSLSSRNNS